MDRRTFCQLCTVMFSFFHRITDAAWTLAGSSEFAVAAENFTLTCDPNDSNVLGVKWRRLDIDTVTASIEFNGCKLNQGYNPQYQYTCEPGPIFKLTIPANVMTNSQNNKVWRCENYFGGPSAYYTLIVAVPVNIVSIQGDSNYPALNVMHENILKTFYCITNGCRPKANITVTTTGVTVGPKTESQNTQSDGLIVTKVTQTITATRGDGVKTLQCTAVNIQGRQPVLSQRVTLEVYYVPTVEPRFSGYTTGRVLYEGDSRLTLTCQQSGGYPLSMITWSCDGQTGTSNSSGTVASSYVQLTVDRNLNGKTCTCTVRHPYITTYSRTKSVTFTVYYPPSTPTLQRPGTNFPWVENTKGVLKCTTTPGNPPQTTHDWMQDSHVITGQTSDTFTIPTLTSDYNGVWIQCRVSNAYTVQKPPDKISNITVLDVQYAPKITLATTTIIVQEGRSLTRLCSAVGNPTPTVKWYRGNSEQTSGIGTSATLVFSDIDRGHADTYICQATSTGIQSFESSKSVLVIVYYPPFIAINLQNTTENATNVVLTCNADGFPANYTYHGWTQYIGDTVVRRYRDFTGMVSERNRIITFPKVTFEDTGKYYCDAENGIQGRQPAVLQSGSSYFNVKASAIFDPNEEVRKPGELHKNLTISIKFYSNPPAVKSDVKWINGTAGNQLTKSQVISLSLSSTQLQRSVHGKTVKLTGQSAMLSIALLQRFHIGHYTLIIQNGENLTSSFNFKILNSGPPDAPSKLTLVANKTISVILTWERGFNGGHLQTFVIRYTDAVTTETQEQKIKDTSQTSNYTAEITGLKPGTIYHFWIYSTNNQGNSTLSVNPVIAKTLKGKGSSEKIPSFDLELQTESSSTTGAVIGGVVGTALAVIIIVALITVFIIRRRKTNYAKNKKISDTIDGTTNTMYEDIDSNVAMAEVNTYESIKDTDNAFSGLDVNDVNTYEDLDKAKGGSDANTYDTLKNKDINDVSVEKVYVNTTIGLGEKYLKTYRLRQVCSDNGTTTK